jgi:UDP-N-acetylglucosamine transferase subunit ALG13
MIFLTVGSEFNFDRLVAAIDSLIAEAIVTEEVVAQIGYGSYRPQHMAWVPTMPHIVYNKHIQKSSGVISHSGMGTIIQCLQMEKPLLVMPRLKNLKEHVNDHQSGTAKKFEERGSILVAYDIRDLPPKINQLKSFQPSTAVLDSRKAMVDYINRFLEDLKYRI